MAPEVPNEQPARILYATHDPIIIAGNEGFTNENGVASGSGSVSDPFIISGWDINASSANGIEIIGTDAHFVIRDCNIYDGVMGYAYGISLEGVVNGTVTSNILSRSISWKRRTIRRVNGLLPKRSWHLRGASQPRGVLG